MCPERNYCPAGSQNPQRCGALSVCEEGASQPSNLVAIIILLFIAVFMGVGIWVRALFPFPRPPRLDWDVLASALGRQWSTRRCCLTMCRAAGTEQAHCLGPGAAHA